MLSKNIEIRRLTQVKLFKTFYSFFRDNCKKEVYLMVNIKYVYNFNRNTMKM